MDVFDRIQHQLDASPVVLFMRGTPDRPMCRASFDAVRILDDCGARYEYVDLQADPEIRAFLPKFSDSPLFPQLFINGELLGGTQILRELHEQGELAAMVGAVPALAVGQ